MSLNLRNKPSFCSGSCNECYAKKKLHKQTSFLKHPWNLKIFVELSPNNLWTSFKYPWSPLKTSLKYPSIFPTNIYNWLNQYPIGSKITFNPPWNTFETSLKLLWNTLKTSLKPPCNIHPLNTIIILRQRIAISLQLNIWRTWDQSVNSRLSVVVQ